MSVGRAGASPQRAVRRERLLHPVTGPHRAPPCDYVAPGGHLAALYLGMGGALMAKMVFGRTILEGKGARAVGGHYPLSEYARLGIPNVVACISCGEVVGFISAMIDQHGRAWCPPCGEPQTRVPDASGV